MIERYFKDIDVRLISSKKDARKGSAKKGAKDKKSSPGRKGGLDVELLRDTLARLIPSHMKIGSVPPIDSTGYSPEGVDLTVYIDAYPDILSIMDGRVPSELVCATFHVVPELDRERLYEAMSRVIAVKKLDYFSGDSEEESPRIPVPSFIVAGSSKYHLRDLKNDVVDRYMAKNIEHRFEFDILAVIGKGLVVKNWREKRSFIALETGSDTFMWFFVLMNEYLDVERKRNVEFRNYIKKEIVYNEY